MRSGDQALDDARLPQRADYQQHASDADDQRAGDRQQARHAYFHGKALEETARIDECDSHASQDPGQANAEGQDEHDAELEPPERDRAEQEDQRGGARDQASADAQGDEGTCRDRSASSARWQVAVLVRVRVHMVAVRMVVMVEDRLRVRMCVATRRPMVVAARGLGSTAEAAVGQGYAH